MPTSQRIIDLGTPKRDFSEWNVFERHRAWKRLQAYLFYPEDDSYRRRFLAVISGHQLALLTRLQAMAPQRTKTQAQIQIALAEEQLIFADTGGVYRLAHAASLADFEAAIPSRQTAKTRHVLRAADVVTAGLMFAKLYDLRSSGQGRKRLNTAINELAERSRSSRELWRLWRRSKSVIHLCAAMLVAAQQAEQRNARLSVRDLCLVLSLATHFQLFVVSSAPYGPLVPPKEFWRLPRLSGLGRIHVEARSP